MTPKEIKLLLKKVKNGTTSESEAFEILKSLPFKDIGFAKIDHHRKLRRGLPEVIFGLGKTSNQIIKIAAELSKHSNVMITKTSLDVFNEIKNIYKNAVFNTEAKIITIKQDRVKFKSGKIIVLTAGTTDIPIAEEAVVTATFFGNKVEKIYDVGVAGIHRLFANLPKIYKSSVIIVVAGMDGALASVVSGLVDKPVIAVPTSCGYGANFEGIGPLLNMLNSCSPGVAVMNIDNGFGAGYFASIINK